MLIKFLDASHPLKMVSFLIMIQLEQKRTGGCMIQNNRYLTLPDKFILLVVNKLMLQCFGKRRKTYMSVGYSWKDIDREKCQFLEKNPSQCHFVCHKIHIDLPSINPGHCTNAV